MDKKFKYSAGQKVKYKSSETGAIEQGIIDIPLFLNGRKAYDVKNELWENKTVDENDIIEASWNLNH